MSELVNLAMFPRLFRLHEPAFSRRLGQNCDKMRTVQIGDTI
jgi:hypothetical protein